MKMIRAIIRPECEAKVVQALEKQGIVAMTKFPVNGRGRQGGVESGRLHYTEMAKLMLMIVAPDDKVDSAVTTIAHAGYTGFPGDGRIFIAPVSKTVRLRTGDIREEGGDNGGK